MLLLNALIVPLIQCKYHRVSNSRTTTILEKLFFILLAKKDNLILLNQFLAFIINFNAQNVNGMTPFKLVENTCPVIRYYSVKFLR